MKAANLTLKSIGLLSGGGTLTVVFSGRIHGAYGSAPKHEEGRSAILALDGGRVPLLP